MKTNLANFLKLGHRKAAGRTKAANRYKIALQKQNKKIDRPEISQFLGEAEENLFSLPVKTA